MTTNKPTGSLGTYILSFSTDTIDPFDFMEDFIAGNIEQAIINEHHIYLINKQGKEITVDLTGFGLSGLAHLNEEKNEKERFHPNEF